MSRDSIVDGDRLSVTDWCHRYDTIRYGSREKIGGWVISCAELTVQGNDFELILTVKMETRHPVEGQFGSEFPAICNHYGVMTAWSRSTGKFCVQFLRFLEKRPLTVNFHNSIPKVFTASPRSTLLCSNVVKFFRREIGEIVRYLRDKKTRLPLKLSLLRGSHPKSARASPQHLSHNFPDFIQIGSLSAKL